MVAVSKYANLNKDELSKLQALEKDIKKIVLAYEDDDESPYASLTDVEVAMIRQVEMDLDVILLAYKKK
jgi:hypothetical protein